ncbi:MAG: hypothetical protein AAFV93_01345 [Chloroflexota bacterium]
MGLSIITSLYRSDEHLPTYAKHIITFAKALEDEHIPLQLVMVVNDATALEKETIAHLQTQLEVDALFVARESLYASWNRGLQVAKYDAIGFWNVDDMRLGESAIAGVRAIENGAELVDMPYIAVDAQTQQKTQQTPYNPKVISPKTIMTMFALFHRGLFEKAGTFNPNFKVVGDFEWCSRSVVRQANYHQLDLMGGYFYIHGDNLSNGTNPLEWVEINTVFLWHGGDNFIRPVEPQLMKHIWEQWGHTGRENLPENIQEWLWGDGAEKRYLAYTKEREQPQWLRRIRMTLARRGFVSSIEWDVHRERFS